MQYKETEARIGKVAEEDRTRFLQPHLAMNAEYQLQFSSYYEYILLLYVGLCTNPFVGYKDLKLLFLLLVLLKHFVSLFKARGFIALCACGQRLVPS